VFDWDRRSARRNQPKDGMMPDRYLTKAAWICEIERGVRNILETVDSNAQTERVLAEELAYRRIVVSGAVVGQLREIASSSQV
jgi:cephalosporin hydroxylase